MFIQRKGIFGLLEAEDDGIETDTASTPEPAGQDEAPSPDESGEDTSSDDYGSDDDFNIDTSLDDTGEDSGSEDSTSDTSSLDSDSGTGEEEAPVQANTDIFGSLTPDEQKMKIKELKNLYADLYTSTDDILERINQTNTDEDNVEVIGRLTSTLYSLRQYMNDYITQIFPIKSFYENDVNFNRFLSMINGIATVIEQIGAIKIANFEKAQ